LAVGRAHPWCCTVKTVVYDGFRSLAPLLIPTRQLSRGWILPSRKHDAEDRDMMKSRTAAIHPWPVQLIGKHECPGHVDNRRLEKFPIPRKSNLNFLSSMSFACIHVPNFSLQAAIRADENLRDQAVAIFDGIFPLLTVIALSPEASQKGLHLGMTKTQ